MFLRMTAYIKYHHSKGPCGVKEIEKKQLRKSIISIQNGCLAVNHSIEKQFHDLRILPFWGISEIILEFLQGNFAGITKLHHLDRPFLNLGRIDPTTISDIMIPLWRSIYLSPSHTVFTIICFCFFLVHSFVGF